MSTPAVKQIPKGALRFVQQGCHAHAFDEGEGEQKRTKLDMVGYSGGLIKGHWWWGDLAIDLQGGKFSKNRYAILENHDDSRKIAHMSKPLIKDNKLLAPEDTVFVDTVESGEFQKLSQQGFPYQSSISGKPYKVEKLEEGAKAEVNGMQVVGPASIWREWEFREMSVCVFGWDSQTSAAAFSKEVTEDVEYTEESVSLSEINTQKGKEVKETMDLKELKEKHPNLFAEVVELGKQGATEALSTSIKTLTDSVTAMAGSLKKVEEDNQKLSQDLKDKELKNEVLVIQTEKLSASGIPANIHSKVRELVSHTKFVKDGALDRDAFGKALDAEIDFWKKLNFADSADDALGLGGNGKEIGTVDPAKLQQETLSSVNQLRKLAGLSAIEKI
jgi:hypothetical protein